MDTPGTVVAVRGNGKGAFGQQTTIATGINPTGMASGDWNGDGFGDMAVGNESGTVEIFTSKVTTASTASLGKVSIPGGGTHDLLASYASNATMAGSKSGKIALAGTPIKTSAALTFEPATPVIKGTTLKFTAVVSPEKTSKEKATGSVKFLDGGTLLGTVTLSNDEAIFSTSTMAVGTHKITAVYSGDTNFVTSTSAVSMVTVDP